MSQLGADIGGAGGQPAVGKVAIPDVGYARLLQGAATSAFGVPLAGAAETVRDALRGHPIASAIVDPTGGLPEVPKGLTADLRAKAEAQRAGYLEAHPDRAGLALAGELGVNLLPMLAGAPAALRGLGVASKAPTVASAAAGALRGAAAGAAIGAPFGYAGSYGAPASERLAAAAKGAGVGALMGGVGGAGASPGAAAEAPPSAPSALDELAAQSLAIGEDRQSPPATERGPLTVRQVTPPDEPRQTLVAHRSDSGEHLGQLVYDKAPGGGFTVYDVATGQRGTGAGRALYQAAAQLEGSYKGAIIQTPEGAGFVDRLRQTNPEIFGEEARSEAPALPDATASDQAAPPAPGDGRPEGAGLPGAVPQESPQAGAAHQPDPAEALGGPGVEAGAAPPGEPPASPPRPRASEPPPPASWDPGLIRAERDLYNAGYEIRRKYVSSDDLGAFEGGQVSDSIRQAIPNAAARQDATAYLQGTGNKAVGRGDTLADVTSRLDAAGARPAVDQVVAGLRPQLDEFHQMVNDLGFQEVPYVKDYVHQMWEPPKDVASPEGLAGQGGASSSSPVTKARQFKSFAQGMALGYEPRTLDLADVAAKTHEIYQRTLALHRAMDDVSRLPELPDGNPVVARGFKAPNDQYVDVTNSPIFSQIAKRMEEKATAADPAAEAPLGDGDHLYLHRQMWTNLRPLVQKYSSNAFGKLYDRLNGLSKQATFAFSLYHPLGSLTPNAIMSMGPRRGIAAAAKGGFGIPGLAQGMDSFAWARPGRDMVADAIRDGVRIPPPESDVGAQGAAGALGWAGDQLGRVPGAGKALALPPKALKRFYEYQNEALWSQHGLRSKLAVYTHSLWKDRALAYRDYLNGQGGSATSLGILRPLFFTQAQKAWLKGASDAQIGQKVAGAVTEFYGDQQWRLLQNRLLNDPVSTRLLARVKAPEWLMELGDPSSPASQKVLRRSFTAPDWFASSVKAPLTAASPNPVRAAMGFKYLKGIAGMAVGYNLLNYAMTGRPMYQNPEGYKYSIDLGPQDPNEPDKGHWYIDVGKQEMELPDAISGKGRTVPGKLPVIGTAFRKAAVFPNSVEGAASGTYFSGYTSPTGKARDEARSAGDDFGLPAWLLAASKTLGAGFVPIPFKPTADAWSGGDYKAAAAGLVFPLRKGPAPEERSP